MNRSIDDRLSVLGSLPELSDLRASQVRGLLRHFDEAGVAAGCVLARAGRPCAQLLVVLEGRLLATGAVGSRTLGPGESWGWREMAARDLNPATVVAAGPARLLVMGRAQFRAVAALLGPAPAASMTRRPVGRAS